VAITGIGLITPLAIGTEETWKALVAGRSGVSKISSFNPAGLETEIAGEVKGFSPLKWISERHVKTMDRFIHFALAASAMALKDSGIALEDSLRERVACYLGVGLGGMHLIESAILETAKRGPRFGISPYHLTAVLPNMAAGVVAQHFGLKGPSLCHATACSSGAHAIGEAMRLIQRGDADAAVAGGSEASLNVSGMGAFNSLRALSKRNAAPEKASRPFERDRDGFVMSEGAGVLVLEEWQRAKARGAQLYAELIGYGASSDAAHPTAPPADGEGAVRCMNWALKDAGRSKDEVSYVNAHGTGTRLNDEVETVALKKVFGEGAKRLSVSSTKSMIGHLLGAAGGVEAAFCALAIRDGVVPPTINYDAADPACDLDYVPNEARRMTVKVAMSNSFGFGGTNACLVLSAP
jgi:3-oxoacyl-[acyl-carrier-protein] synthase II